MPDDRVMAEGADAAAKPARRERVLAVTAIYNEEDRITPLAGRYTPGLADALVVINDGSTDRSAEILRGLGLHVIDQPHRGLGAAIRRAIDHARASGFDVVVLFAGNGKDDPREIPRVIAPILEGRADYVQGSRYLAGGSHANTPLFRLVTIKLLSWLFSLYMRRPCTDLTNGFRAYRISLVDDPRLDLAQPWLDGYELEYYIHWYAYKLRYRVAEVPVSKSYPAQKGVAYSKIRPFTGWWQMLRPFVFLALGIKK